MKTLLVIATLALSGCQQPQIDPQDVALSDYATTMLTAASHDDLLALLKEVPPDAVILIGYRGDDGDIHALSESDLRCP
jgi:hypothetical protein